MKERAEDTSEMAGRLMICASLLALFFVLGHSWLEAAAGWSSKELRVLPRVSIFVLAGLLGLILQGGRPGRSLLLGLGSAMLGLAALSLWLTMYGFGAGGLMRVAAVPLDLLRLEMSLLAALLLGTWLGREISSPHHLLGLLLCASVGDLWLNTCQVPESVRAPNILMLLRVPWPPVQGQLAMMPAFTDILFFAATTEGACRLKLPLLPALLGGVSGYCAASFLSLIPWPAWPGLSMIMFTSGVVLACWPEIKCSAREAGRSVLLSAFLLLVLTKIATLNQRWMPPPDKPTSRARQLNVT